MNRRESLKLIALGLISGPEALEELARLSYRRQFFPGADFNLSLPSGWMWIKGGNTDWHDMINSVFNSNHKLYIPRKII